MDDGPAAVELENKKRGEESKDLCGLSIASNPTSIKKSPTRHARALHFVKKMTKRNLNSTHLCCSVAAAARPFSLSPSSSTLFSFSLLSGRLRRRSSSTAPRAAASSDNSSLPPAPVRQDAVRQRALEASRAKEAKNSKKGKKAVDPRPPRPDTKVFFKDDVERIRDLGASATDVTARTKFLVEDDTAGWPAPGSGEEIDESRFGELVEAEYRWVPISVTGDAFVGEEPQWNKLEEMSSLELLRGLRERNWTDEEAFDPEALPWSVEIFKDVGRPTAPCWPGYRVLVRQALNKQGTLWPQDKKGKTKEGKRVVSTATKWVDLPQRGEASTFAFDATAGGTAGGFFRAPRFSAGGPGRPSEVGYAAIFEQLFQAFEQRFQPEELANLAVDGFVEQTAETYDCPGDRLLEVKTGMIPPRDNPIRAVVEILPLVLSFAFGLSFLGAAIVIGLFRKKRGMPTDLQEAVEFAQSKGKARREGTTGVAFADVAGQDELLGDLAFVVEFLRDPASYARLGAAPPKGILLEGGPGTGKTLIAKAVAGEAGVPFYAMSGAEFVEAIVGVGAARVRDLFKRARVQPGPCIIFIDEVDAIGAKRAEGDRQPNEEREQTLNQLLSELDGFTPGQGVVFIAATNRADLLDDALLRPGRFDRRVTIGLPDSKGRLDVLRIHARKKLLGEGVDLEQLALDTPGLSGAELANVVNEAALSAARRGAAAVEQADFDSALDRILYGLKRPMLPDRLAPKRHMAVYEAGTGVLCEVLRIREREEKRRRKEKKMKKEAASSESPSSSLFIDDSDSLPLSAEAVERLSIVPRGDSWSRTILARRGEAAAFVVTRARVEARLQILLAGHAAETLLGGKEGPSTYAAKLKALDRARMLAEKALGEYGFFGSSVSAGKGLSSSNSSSNSSSSSFSSRTLRPPVYAPHSPTGPASLVTSKFRVEVGNLDTDAFGGSPPRGAGFQPPDVRRDAQRVDAFRLVRAAHAAAIRALSAYRPALEEVVELLMKNGDVSGEELRRAIENNPPVKVEGGGAQVNAKDESEDEFADLEAIFQKFRFDEGFVPEDEGDADDWIEDERRSERGEDVVAEWEGKGSEDENKLVDDCDGTVSAAPAPAKPEPVRPRSTSPQAIREGLGAPEPEVTALQKALFDAAEDRAQRNGEGGEEEEGRDKKEGGKFWADQPAAEVKRWTM